ncbi:MAG: Hpt domain-containing protein [Proteobacteria bacterium]|nr:Hpt domain-containing protein [Pseudomonadota bacterium]MBU1594695.1 Hpt domain-containing protein [Pseudomonadota bacterium]
MTEPKQSPSPVDTRPPINEAWLTRMRSTKPEFLARLFAVFLDDEPARLAKLKEAVATGDLDMVRYLAHSIKGAGATLGMERLSDAARALEQAAKGGQAHGLAGALSLVQDELEAVFAVMREDRFAT